MFQQKFKLAVVCSSNQNRSMEAHYFLMKKGFQVRSFGSGNQVKLPGSSADSPNVYDFNTTYEQMYQDLINRDRALYTQNGILHMLDRNIRLKPRPERFQSCKEHFDIVITCEERVYDQCIEELTNRETGNADPGSQAHIINIEIHDNHEEATLGAFLICDLCVLEKCAAEDYGFTHSKSVPISLRLQLN
ncbi:RNA polymerase II subunit A C-terminal domain phosphatase SSU72-like isoform X2 [Watersipora subatra]|uniref:RNA polymerase II subunit A C-terminal domain phosphatase SSU72-like isoform X2 n=1 Tax=Watersipora subatra TaxID=2589382 RepID=UPI00355AE82B